MANYQVPKELLLPYVPMGTELDFWQDRCYVSLVGFMFLNTRVLWLSIPFHRNFEEVNLRFYVRRKTAQGWRRGVVFIKEIVPKPAITFVANTLYGEKYATQQMRHQWAMEQEYPRISYEWRPFLSADWYKLAAEIAPVAQPIAIGSEAEFITEHYWGYAKTGAQSTNEYQVDHPRWEVYPVRDFEISGDFGRLYGKEFGPLLEEPPVSVFVAEGSEITVMGKQKLV